LAAQRIAIVLGTTRKGRFADKAAAWISAIAQRRTDAEFEVVDLRDFPMPFFDEEVAPLYRQVQDPVGKRWAEHVAGFDGFIFVTAEYNHGPPAVLKNAIDHAYHELNRKPVAFVGYGGVGAARAIEQLRLHCIELEMAPTRTAVHVSLEPFLEVLQQRKNLADFAYLEEGAVAMLDQLSWWTDALKTAREKT
jgi:NAD(P)H-dependent FMN reductase